MNFTPGISNDAAKAIRQTIGRWRLHCRIDKKVDDLARMFNPVIQGWINYYGGYYKSALYPTLRYLDQCLTSWARSKIQTSEAASSAFRALAPSGCRPITKALCPLAIAESDVGWTVGAG